MDKEIDFKLRVLLLQLEYMVNKLNELNLEIENHMKLIMELESVDDN